MTKGLSFKGRHSSQFDVVMVSDNRQVLPLVRDEYEYGIDRDGGILFDDGLSDRFIDISFTILTETNTALREKARKIAAWLQSRQREELVFDDEPDKFYRAKVANQIDLQQVASLGEFTVTFRCEPYAYSREDSETFDVTEENQINTVVVEGTAETPPTIFLVNNGGTINGFTVSLESEI